MTVAIGVCVPEGTVLAGDSRGTYGNPRHWPRIASDYVQKVFEVSKYVGCVTFGWGVLGGRNIHSLVEDVKRTINDSECRIEKATDTLSDFFEAQYEAHVKAGSDQPAAPGCAFGFIIAGYDVTGEAHVWVLRFPGKLLEKRSSTKEPGVTWQGDHRPICRLIKGYDPRIDLSKLPQNVADMLAKSEYLIYFHRMTLQDAVDFAVFLVRVTIGAQRISDGIFAAPGDCPTVGGPIDVCVISPSGLKWIQKKELHGEVPSWIDGLN